jgi:hypothetical protein
MFAFVTYTETDGGAAAAIDRGDGAIFGERLECVAR